MPLIRQKEESLLYYVLLNFLPRLSFRFKKGIFCGPRQQKQKVKIKTRVASKKIFIRQKRLL